MLPTHETEIIKKAVSEAIEAAIKKTLPNTDQLRYQQLENLARTNTKLLTGNGEPKNGLVYQFQEFKTNMTDDMAEVKKKIARIETASWAIVFIVLAWVITQILETMMH